MPQMQFSCHTCSTPFLSLRANAKYCCVRCRKAGERKAERERDWSRATVEESKDNRVLGVELNPCSERVRQIRAMLKAIVPTVGEARAWHFCGKMPDDWQELGLSEQIGVRPPTWAVIEFPETALPIVPTLKPGFNTGGTFKMKDAVDPSAEGVVPSPHEQI